jgi:hypothetical protein
MMAATGDPPLPGCLSQSPQMEPYRVVGCRSTDVPSVGEHLENGPNKRGTLDLRTRYHRQVCIHSHKNQQIAELMRCKHMCRYLLQPYVCHQAARCA